ncbi:MAG: DUF3313 domain-containing protein [Gammaproteobacteria bacterium]|nr:DUF3313 domain-containing protein [Gammaproteobacteria bacterium]
MKLLFGFLVLLGLAPGLLLAGAPSHTAFLDGDIAFEADPENRYGYRYIKKDAGKGGYRQIEIAPIEIWMHPDSSYKAIQVDGFKAVTDQLHKSIVTSLAPDFSVVEKKARGKALALRIAITGVKLRKEQRDFIGYTSIGLAPAAAQRHVAYHAALSDALIETELLDSQTGERVGAFVDQSLAKKLNGRSQTWDEIKSVLALHSKSFKESLEDEYAR